MKAAADPRGFWPPPLVPAYLPANSSLWPRPEHQLHPCVLEHRSGEKSGTWVTVATHKDQHLQVEDGRPIPQAAGGGGPKVCMWVFGTGTASGSSWGLQYNPAAQQRDESSLPSTGLQQ